MRKGCISLSSVLPLPPQVMGAPLVGSEVQLAALCGGGLYVCDLGFIPPSPPPPR